VRKAKLAGLKAAVEAHADAIVAAVLEDTRKPEGEIRVTEVLNVTADIQRNIDNLDAWMAPPKSPHRSIWLTARRSAMKRAGYA